MLATFRRVVVVVVVGGCRPRGIKVSKYQVLTTPSGDKVSSTSYDVTGQFHLLLPNPVTGGNYTCQVSGSQVAVRCVASDAPLLREVTVSVDEQSARFAVVLARQQELIDWLKTDRLSLWDTVHTLNNHTLQQLTDNIEAALSAQPISFHVRLSHNAALNSGAILKMSRVVSNQGEGYDPSTGYFTAPRNGTYFFIATTGSYSSNNYANMHLMNKGSEVAQTYVRLGSTFYNMGSCHAVLDLNIGDKVWLQSSASSYFWGTVTSFSGYRI